MSGALPFDILSSLCGQSRVGFERIPRYDSGPARSLRSKPQDLVWGIRHLGSLLHLQKIVRPSDI
jgi:hypothetical protein